MPGQLQYLDVRDAGQSGPGGATHGGGGEYRQ